MVKLVDQKLHFYFENVAEELDEDGEYFIDR